MSLAVLLALATVFQLERIALQDCASRDGEIVCRFEAPPRLAERQVRLQARCAAPVRVNGIAVSGGSEPPAISGFLAGRGGNEVAAPMACGPLELLVTPRVYIASGRQEGSGVRILVENALDNTVNVSLSCRLEGSRGEGWRASGTVPALSSHEFAWPAGTGVAEGARLSCMLEKQAESVEESYTFRWVYIFHTLTEIGSPKHR